MKKLSIFCGIALILALMSGSASAIDDVCQKLQSKYQICMEHTIKYPAHTLDIDVCDDFTTESTCGEAGCYWWALKSKCLPYITYSDINLDGKVSVADFPYWKYEFSAIYELEPEIIGFYGAPVEKTGQTTSYDPTRDGEDGDLQKGVLWPNPRFTITYCDESGECTDQGSDCDENSSTDVVTDNLTGLMWSRDAWLSQDSRTWQGSLDYVDGMNDGGGLCGHTDWRLPNVKELSSLIDFSQYGPALLSGHPFTEVQTDHYWSSTTISNDTNSAWFVKMSAGHSNGSVKSAIYYVWPVRGGQ